LAPRRRRGPGRGAEAAGGAERAGNPLHDERPGIAPEELLSCLARSHPATVNGQVGRDQKSKLKLTAELVFKKKKQLNFGTIFRSHLFDVSYSNVDLHGSLFAYLKRQLKMTQGF